MNTLEDLVKLAIKEKKTATEFLDSIVNTSDITNSAPINIELSSTTVNEGAAVGTVIGTLSNTDEIQEGIINTYTFTLLSHPTRFEIVGTTLKTKQVFDYESINSYNVIIQVNNGGHNFLKELKITILDDIE